MIAAVFISDRGDLYLPECLKSFNAQPQSMLVDHYHIVNDSEHLLGMAGAVQAGWQWASDMGADHILHIEEDFVFDELPLAKMLWILDHQPQLAQVVLKRQPWSAEEVAAGGIIEMQPKAYTECHDDRVYWVEHETLFSLNPCLIPRRTFELGWPSGELGVGNESGMTTRCLDRGYKFAYYGTRWDAPRVHHVGAQRGRGWRL